MATNAEKALAQDLVEDFVAEELERSGEPFRLEPGKLADGYGVSERAVKVVCERLAGESRSPLHEQDGGFEVRKN